LGDLLVTPLQTVTLDVWRRAVKAQHPAVRRYHGAEDAILEALVAWLANGPDLARAAGVHAYHVGLRAREILTPTSRRAAAVGVQCIVPRLRARVRCGFEIRGAEALPAPAPEASPGEEATLEALAELRVAWGQRVEAFKPRPAPKPAAPTTWQGALALLTVERGSVRRLAQHLAVSREAVGMWRRGLAVPTPARVGSLLALANGT
jgi:hypothetical protein